MPDPSRQYSVKEHVLVTLADENYIDQAKQLFSSAYWHGGWDGDYLLLAHEIPEEKLKWFRDKGIFVHECHTMGQGKANRRYPPSVASKLHIFDVFFKQWKKVVFMDGDIIVKGSLDGLVSAPGFSAKRDFGGLTLNWQIDHGHKANGGDREKYLIKKLASRYDLNAPSFNCGVMVLDTSLIQYDSYERLRALFDEYGDVSMFFGDQLSLNLFMYKKWQNLPARFNCYVLNPHQSKFFTKEELVAPILHFAGTSKVWLVRGPFRVVWRSNLAHADMIDLARVITAKKPSTEDVERSERIIIERERAFAKKLFPDIASVLLLDDYYQCGKMKEFRHLLVKALFESFSSGYFRFIPYFFASYIPPNLKTRMKGIFKIWSR